ncbi:hypothetical protein Rsub_05845 [Raphidocelis subcapitata]|uniref:Uncharacterized protein n=1 Tax=Raphidocelis subcapitata TaxID=307507 RepID=A0A2V0NZS8_9CHLO|nr:hypothetical protein Rsub_05845 [Raphidocelis subcapitata]|eukprot:GBF93116.1 hypothetical protein Rsub_05845 [Raphidocelis subcapitata]
MATSSPPPTGALPGRSGSRDEGTPKVKMPEGNDAVLQKAASPLATVSSHTDPWPHYIMSGACGGAAYHQYAKMNNPRMAGITLAVGAAYLWAGRMLVNGNPRLGYDLGLITSLGLVALAGPRASSTGETASTVMASLGGVSAITNLIKSYQTRTGKPKELGYTRE